MTKPRAIWLLPARQHLVHPRVHRLLFPERDESWHALIRAARGFGPLDWSHSQAALTINNLRRDLLAGGAPLLIDHLAAESPMPRHAARRFLERVSEQSHGDDVQAWRAWIAGLGGG